MYGSDIDTAIAIANMNTGWSISSWFSLIMSILTIVGNWKVFSKAGEAGWKSLIPIYNRYVLCNVARKSDVFWKLIACEIAAFVGKALGVSGMAANAGATAGIGYLLVIAGGIGCWIFQWQVCKGLAENFGLDTAFAVGLFLLNGLFMVILGLGKYEYVTASESETIDVDATPVEDSPEATVEVVEETKDE